MSDTLPRDARLIALMLASSPAISDAQPGVLHQLLEFAHRYTGQVLGDALTYADHAGRTGNIQMEDVTLAIQSRVGWEFGGRVPKEHLLSLATKTNSEPLPTISETYGIRLPPQKYCLTAIDFDLVPNKPPPQDMPSVSSDEEDEDAEDEEDEAEIDEAMDEDLFSPRRDADGDTNMMTPGAEGLNITTSMDGLGLLSGELGGAAADADSDSDEGPDGLFDDDEEDEQEEESPGAGAGASSGPQVGEKRKLDEDDEY
ncbi:TFIID-31kDa-domain-containing protein, partial [Clavulina sp. PMI_390]